MTLIIAGFAAGAAFMLLMVVWLITAYKKLSGKRKAAEQAEAERKLHRTLYESQRDGPQREQAERMLEMSRRLYEERQQDYRATLQAPLYRIPGALLGFRAPEKGGES